MYTEYEIRITELRLEKLFSLEVRLRAPINEPKAVRIDRQTLRAQATAVLRERILSGELTPGQVLREEHAAARLGISRTPLREALLQLTRDGLLSKDTGRGFVVNALDARDVRELYPLRGLLESEALRQAGIPGPRHLDDLETLNRELRAEPPGAGWIHLDDRWHERLVAGCDNRTLHAMMHKLREQTHRYELAFLRGGGDPVISTGQHEEILRHLRSGDLEAACKILAENMTVGMASLLGWLEGSTNR